MPPNGALTPMRVRLGLIHLGGHMLSGDYPRSNGASFTDPIPTPEKIGIHDK